MDNEQKNMPLDPMTALGAGAAGTVEMWQELVKQGMPQTQASIYMGTMMGTMSAMYLADENDEQ